MIKTLLAGTLLSTGLLAGGAVGANDTKMDNLKSNKDNSNQAITQSADGKTSFSPIHDVPKNGVPATYDGDTPKDGVLASHDGDGKDNTKMDRVESNEDGSITTSADGKTVSSQIFNAPKDAVSATFKEDLK
ncbi:hypothetical protein CN424_28220 [Bacillus cereus]|nr:hypothetical protein CN424_28220 [Bacillus cereus]